MKCGRFKQFFPSFLIELSVQYTSVTSPLGFFRFRLFSVGFGCKSGFRLSRQRWKISSRHNSDGQFSAAFSAEFRSTKSRYVWHDFLYLSVECQGVGPDIPVLCSYHVFGPFYMLALTPKVSSKTVKAKCFIVWLWCNINTWASRCSIQSFIRLFILILILLSFRLLSNSW